MKHSIRAEWFGCSRLVLASVLLLLCGRMAAAQTDPADSKTKRLYLMGSSLTDSINKEGFAKLAESRGYRHIWGNHMMAGSPISFFWSHPEGGGSRKPFGPGKQAMSEYEWDAITLEPRAVYDKELEAAANFIDLATKKSPRVQFYVYAKWPRIRGGSFDKQWLSGEKDVQNNNRFGVESFLADLRKMRPNMAKPPLILPTGHAMHLLDLKCKAGFVPGMTSIYDGYNDGSHQNVKGKYIAGCSWFATIYGETPVGLPTEPYGPIEPPLARAIQETVWEAVNAHPDSGVKAPGEFRLITPYFPPAIEGEAYEREIQSAFGQFPVTHTLASGSLPPGITMEPKGLLTGTPTKVGRCAFTLKATDAAGRTATRELSLQCDADSVPTIPEQTIDPIARGQHVRHRMKVEGGNGDIAWRVKRVLQRVTKDGQEDWQPRVRAGKPVMPTGLELSYGGLFEGSPGLEGVYKITVITEDSDPADPDAAERELALVVGPARPEVCFVPSVDRQLGEVGFTCETGSKRRLSAFRGITSGLDSPDRVEYRSIGNTLRPTWAENRRPAAISSIRPGGVVKPVISGRPHDASRRCGQGRSLSR